MAVDLTREPPLRLGGLEVRPATGELVWGSGRQVLQPRVMQVLVLLASRRGEVVSRDELVNACWAGRTVGDDALNRCIVTLRRCARTTGAFALETFARVGYRLDETPSDAALGKSKSRRLRVVVAVLGTVGLVLLAAAGWFGLRSASPHVPRVEVAAFQAPGGDPRLRALATSLTTDIAGFLAESGVQTTASLPSQPAAGDRRPADFMLRGVVQEAEGRLRIRVFIENPRADLTLWSRDFEGPRAEAGSLRLAAAVASAESIYAALEPLEQRGYRLDPEVLAIHIRASELISNPNPLRQGEALRATEEIVARAPGLAVGHGLLALALSREAGIAGPQAGAMRERAKQEAQTAIRIDSRTAGPAYDALYFLQRQVAPADLVTAENVILDGLRRAPDYPFLLMRECRLLVEVGRPHDAVRYCERAKALRPLAAPIAHSYARALRAAGLDALGQQAVIQAATRHPGSAATRRLQFEDAAYQGDTSTARRLLHDPTAVPLFELDAIAAIDAYLHARETGRPADADAAQRALLAYEPHVALAPFAARALAALGRVDAAYDILGAPDVNPAVYDGGGRFLLEPVARPLRRDPRFWTIAARAGLTDYWLRRDRWPDFCGAQTPLPDCRREAARVTPRGKAPG